MSKFYSSHFSITLLLLLPNLISLNLKSQIPIHERFDVSKGLHDNTAYDISLDYNGFLWITTDEGIQRFDGNKFLSFIYTDNINKSGSCIQFDYRGRVWYQSFDGHLFYVENDTVKTLQHFKAKNFTTFRIIDSILTFYNGNSLVKVNLKTLNIIDQLFLPNAEISSIVFFKNSYYISGNGIFRINVDFKKIDTLDTRPGIISIFTNDNELFYQTKSDISYEVYKLADTTKILFYSDVVRINWIDLKNNTYYISTNLGLQIQERNKKNYLMTDYKFSKTFFDNYGQLIASTLNAGILIIPNENDIKYFHNLKENFTSTIFTQNKIFLATELGKIFEFDITNKKSKLLYADVYKRQINHFIFNPNYNEFVIILNNEVKIIHPDGREIFSVENVAPKSVTIIDDKYYFVTATGGNGFLEHVFNPLKKSIWDSLYDASEKVNKFRKFTNLYRNRDVIFSSIHKKIFISTNTGVIIAGSNGDISAPNPNLFLKELFQIKDDIYGIDFKNQLYKYDYKRNIFNPIKIPYSKNDVRFILSNNSIFFLIFNRIYELKEGKPVETDLVSNQNIKYIYKFKDIFLEISNSHLSYKNNISERRINFPKKIIINHVNGKRPNDTENIEIKYEKGQDVRVNYTFLNLDKRSTSRLYYRINQGQWNPILSGTDYLLFPSLKPDKYTIDFAIKEFGKLDIIKAFNIIVTTPIYKQTWFLILFQFFILILFVLYVLWQIRLLSKKNKLVTEKAEIEKNLALMTLKSIKAQMNPHFFFNALNTIQAFIYANDKLSATQYLSKFSKLTRLILENSEAEQIDLASELKTIAIYLELEKMRFVNNFEFDICTCDDEAVLKEGSFFLSVFKWYLMLQKMN
ncbi:histidine kinase [Thermaurantimonas aggregans]|uniref:histidine kinase n=1 Tax=Thermaurantimonas aggregans TaxID=2173829 RepID=UPI0023F3F7FF|nr:histidine kinase [Thermaurantimonas aggregans]MCX8149780.1 histidine kinase [Thermaurantimonas aggregans]